MIFSSRTYLPKSRAKFPYARGWVLDWRKTPSGAMEAASDPKLIQGCLINVRTEIKQPWMSFGSDAASMAPEGVFLQSSTHPRAYGNFARLLGKYVRDEKIISLQEAVRRLTSLPASNLKLRHRGALKPDYFADVVIFDPAKIGDHATFDQPQQYASGMV